MVKASVARRRATQQQPRAPADQGVLRAPGAGPGRVAPVMSSSSSSSTRDHHEVAEPTTRLARTTKILRHRVIAPTYRFLRTTLANPDHWWFVVFAAGCVSYALLLRLYLEPATLTSASIDAALVPTVFRGTLPEVLVEGLERGDGAVWRATSSCIIYADVAANRLWRHEDGSGLVRIGQSTFLGGAGCRDAHTCATLVAPGAAAVAEYAASFLALAEQGSKVVSIVASDGARRVLASTDHVGNLLNGPNALAVHRATGDLYFADVYAGTTAASEEVVVVPVEGGSSSKNNNVPRRAPRNGVYRVVKGASPEPVALFDDGRPEALALVDNATLFVGDADGGVWVVDLAAAESDDSSLPKRRKLADFELPVVGLTLDNARRLYAATSEGVAVLFDERLVGVVHLGGAAATDVAVATDGYLYVTTRSSLLRLRLAAGIAPHTPGGEKSSSEPDDDDPRWYLLREDESSAGGVEEEHRD